MAAPEMASHDSNELCAPCSTPPPVINIKQGGDGFPRYDPEVWWSWNEYSRWKAKMDPSKYKTELCHNVLELGSCQFGPRCCFAHSDDEIRNRDRKQTATPCISFHLLTFCPYGTRCQYEVRTRGRRALFGCRRR